jgi:hypothetical protein
MSLFQTTNDCNEEWSGQLFLGFMTVHKDYLSALGAAMPCSTEVRSLPQCTGDICFNSKCAEHVLKFGVCGLH